MFLAEGEVEAVECAYFTHTFYGGFVFIKINAGTSNVVEKIVIGRGGPYVTERVS